MVQLHLQAELRAGYYWLRYYDVYVLRREHGVRSSTTNVDGSSCATDLLRSVLWSVGARLVRNMHR